ncbi:uncharacterized protein DS421_12g361060 [Arachis hypogaea]|nr:uncharacterized protein DS421_12g361060 [Arachis hypogaea]
MANFVGYEVSNKVNSELTISWDYGCNPTGPGRGRNKAGCKHTRGPLNKFRCCNKALVLDGQRPEATKHVGGNAHHEPSLEISGRVCSGLVLKPADWGNAHQQGLVSPAVEASAPGDLRKLGATVSRAEEAQTSPDEERVTAAGSQAVR